MKNRSFPFSIGLSIMSAILMASGNVFSQDKTASIPLSTDHTNSVIADGMTSYIVPDSVLTDWSSAGVLPESHRNAVDVFDVSTEPGMNWDDKIVSALKKAKDSPGLSIIQFPSGVYPLNSPIVLDDSSFSDIVFQGKGADSTILEFLVGRDGICFTMKGGSIGQTIPLTSDVVKNSRIITAEGMAERVSKGDWIHLCEYAFPETDRGNVGQIEKVLQVDGNRAVILNKANKTYRTSNQLWIKKIAPIQGVGIENLTVRRRDTKSSLQNAYDKGSNFTLNYAVNCWIRGVASLNTSRHHVSITQSAHLEISGSYFSEACSRDENSYGYGVLMEVCTNHCLVQNNIFHRLRHAMVLCEGVSGNVIALNYSVDQNWTFHGFPNIFQGADLCLHGRYPYSNLFEENIAEYIYADNSHGVNGPYNVFLRNLIFKGKGGIRLYKAPNSIVLGNFNSIKIPALVRYEDCGPLLDLFGKTNLSGKTDHRSLRDRKNILEHSLLPMRSFYYPSRPDFIPKDYSWPCLGPSPDGNPLTQSIPAKERYLAGEKTFLMNSTTAGE
jgi:hypothetical protein